MYAILIALGGMCSPTLAEPPGAANTPSGSGNPPAPPAASKRKEPPAPPRQYLVAGSSLFNNGRYELASKYFAAAQMYRDRLTPSEQIVLDVYVEKLDEYRRTLRTTKTPDSEAGNQARPSLDPGVSPTSLAPAAAEVVPDRSPLPASVEPANQPRASAPRLGLDKGPVYGSATWRDSATPKEKARWLMQLAREQIFKGHYDIAEQAIAEARVMDVKWTMFDETPEKMTEALKEARAKKEKVTALAANHVHDRREARARLREARVAVSLSEYEKAESIVREVKSWQVRYSLFDDSPDKVANALAEARRRQAGRSGEPSAKAILSDQPAADPTRLPRPGPPVADMPDPSAPPESP